MKERLHKEIEQAKKNLQLDLKEFGVVGSGFWEATEQKILDKIREWLSAKRQDFFEDGKRKKKPKHLTNNFYSGYSKQNE